MKEKSEAAGFEPTTSWVIWQPYWAQPTLLALLMRVWTTSTLTSRLLAVLESDPLLPAKSSSSTGKMQGVKTMAKLRESILFDSRASETSWRNRTWSWMELKLKWSGRLVRQLRNEECKYANTWWEGGLHSTEVAYLLLTQQFQVWFPAFPKKFQRKNCQWCWG